MSILLFPGALPAAAGILSVNNGITQNPTGNAQLGGMLIQNTDIDPGVWDLDLGPLTITSSSASLSTAPVNPTDIVRLVDLAGIATTADNGLAINPANNVRLGGMLLHDTTVFLDTHNFQFSNADGTVNTVFTPFPGSGFYGNAIDPFSYIGAYSFSSTSMHLAFSSYSGPEIVGIDFDNNLSIQFTDTFNNLGAKYAADYSAVGVLNPRWIPDYGAVQAAIVAGASASNGLSVVSGTVELGGSLLANTDVTTSGFTLGFSNVNGFFNIADTGYSFQYSDPGNPNQLSILNIDASEALIGLNNIGGGGVQNIDFTPGGVYVNDTNHSRGLQNAGNFEAQMLLNPNVLASAGFVENNTAFKFGYVGANGQTASGAIQSVTPPSPISVMRVNIYLLYRPGGTGTADVSLSYVDGNGDAQGQTVTSTLAATGYATYTGMIVAGNGSNVVVFLNTVGVVLIDVGSYIEVITP